MLLSMILAADENNLIGNENKLIWHLPNDLQFFKKTTLGHHIIMGRKTFDSIGKPLPGRKSVVITRDQSWNFEGVEVVHSLADAIALCKADPEAFIIGGAQIYRLGMSIADKIYFTRVHHEFEGDTYFDGIDLDVWRLEDEEFFSKDEKNKFDHSIQIYHRLAEN